MITTVPEWITCSNGLNCDASEVTLLGFYAEDEMYQFDEAAAVLWNGRLWMLQTSGCSCPTPGEQAGVYAGPCATPAELREHITRRGYPNSVARALEDAERAGESEVAPPA